MILAQKMSVKLAVLSPVPSLSEGCVSVRQWLTSRVTWLATCLSTQPGSPRVGTGCRCCLSKGLPEPQDPFNDSLRGVLPPALFVKQRIDILTLNLFLKLELVTLVLKAALKHIL